MNVVDHSSTTSSAVDNVQQELELERTRRELAEAKLTIAKYRQIIPELRESRAKVQAWYERQWRINEATMETYRETMRLVSPRFDLDDVFTTINMHIADRVVEIDAEVARQDFFAELDLIFTEIALDERDRLHAAIADHDAKKGPQ